MELQCHRLAGGLVWLGILTFGVVSEQIKTRLEDSAERKNTQVVCALPGIPWQTKWPTLEAFGAELGVCNACQPWCRKCMRGKRSMSPQQMG